MIKIDNVIIQATTLEILELLKLELQEENVLRFNQIKDSSLNIQVSCPFHKQGQERKASFGVHKETGDCHCFTCGWSGNLFKAISEIYNKFDKGEYGRKWCLKRFNSTLLEERKVNILQPRQNVDTRKISMVTEHELDTYRYYHEYMYKRGLTNRIIEKFDVGYDKSTNCVTFPIYDENNNCLFIARRSVRTKFFSYPEEADKPVYALNKCKELSKVYIVESIFNCLTLWKYGKPAVALIGLGSKTQIEILKKCKIRHFVLALDPDYRGRIAQDKLKKALNNKILSELIYKNETEDINDLQEKVLELREVLL